MNKISSRENFSTGKRGRGKMLANFVNLSSVPFSSSPWRVATLGFFLFFFFERIIVSTESNGNRARYIVI